MGRTRTWQLSFPSTLAAARACLALQFDVVAAGLENVGRIRGWMEPWCGGQRGSSWQLADLDAAVNTLDGAAGRLHAVAGKLGTAAAGGLNFSMVGLHLPTEEFDFVVVNLDLAAVAADLPTSQLDLQPLTHGTYALIASPQMESNRHRQALVQDVSQMMNEEGFTTYHSLSTGKVSIIKPQIQHQSTKHCEEYWS
ncbi:unnamed protein product [Urochloa humidicola]